MAIQQAAWALVLVLYCTFVGGLQLVMFRIHWQIYRQNSFRNENELIYIVKQRKILK